MFIGFWGCSDLGENPVDSNCSGIPDCAGVCDGSAVKDECGICDGDGSSCNISYSVTIQPIFNNNCTGCHGSDGGLSLASWGDLMAGTSNNGPVVSEMGSESYIIKKLRGADTILGSQMPQTSCCLDESIIQLIETWINEGALDN